jgi:hypothetical protein
MLTTSVLRANGKGKDHTSSSTTTAKRKSNGKTNGHQESDINAPAYTNEPEYKAAVVEGKAIVATISSKQWALGDLADKVVEKNYGENALEQFAEDINFDGRYTTLDGYRRVCRAFPKNLGRPRFFASAQVLASHPDRAKIVKRNAEISEREAREIMRGSNQKRNRDKQKGNGDKDTTGWFNDQVEHVNAVINELNQVMENCSPAQHDRLHTLEPTLLLEASQQLTEKAAEFKNWVETPLEKAADAQQGRVEITSAPKPARRARRVVPLDPAQPGA